MTRLLIWFKRLVIAAAVVLIGFVALAPNKDTYTSNADALVTRTLVPRETTTTVRVSPDSRQTSTTLPVYTVELDKILVIDGDHVIRLPRTSNVMLYLWLATYAYR